ncbi:MAG TPA: AsmA-like C-terminal region-containing protein [Acidocella sp.]|nr:AsmA-like C-terminal region-containing protein [Acidocella sp.]
MSRKHLWLLPLSLAILLGAAILALPSFVASSTHRGTIEALASSLTGREVRINGNLSLALLPAPQLVADHVTITGPDDETIQARSLTLAISLPALLHGQLHATSLTLISPQIDLPWPLPGGSAAVTPPSWLAALHAQIQDGAVTLGQLHLDNVNASIVTGADSAITVSGNGLTQGRSLSLTLALAGTGATGTAPLRVDVKSGDVTGAFLGALNSAGEVTGRLGLNAPHLTAKADLNANATALSATMLQIHAGAAGLAGSARLRFLRPAPELSATLTGENLDLSALTAVRALWPRMRLDMALKATNVAVLGQRFPTFRATLADNAGTISASQAQASLASGGLLTGSLAIDPAGAISGNATLQIPSLPDLLSSYGIPAPPGWTSATLSTTLSGTRDQPVLQHLTGEIDGDHVTGELIIHGHHANGSLAFTRLDLTPLLSWFTHRPNVAFSADGQITAAKATLGPVPLTNLLLDGTLGKGLNIRRVSARLYNGLAAGSLALDAKGQVSNAQSFVTLPSAAPLAALLPAAWRPPLALLQPRLNLTLVAEGPPGALATSAVATLGDFTLTAAPTIDLNTGTASGPATLRNPDAIAAATIFHVNHGLAWPGAGSLSLRARMLISPTQFGLPDFVLSFGALTANGHVVSTNGAVAGDVDADTLALPPLDLIMALPWSRVSQLPGTLKISANRVLYTGQPVLGAAQGTVTVGANGLEAVLTRGAIAGGNLTGSFTATIPSGAPPALALKFAGTRLDARQLDLPIEFPFTLPDGTVTATADLTASGYEPSSWRATLSGTTTLTAAHGQITGFDLAALVRALNSPGHRHLRASVTSGTSAFDSLAVSATFSNGEGTLTAVRLTAPSGSATMVGNTDMVDHSVALRLSLQPKVTPPLNIENTILGSWHESRQYPLLQAAQGWKPAT